MALTLTSRQVDPNGASAVRAVPGNLFYSLTSVTLDGSYVAGGIALTPAQLGHADGVLLGVVSLRTPTGAGTISDGVLDCTNPSAPKLKLTTTTGEIANASNSGAIVDVLAFGY